MSEINKKDFPLTVHQNLNELRSKFSKNFKSASPTNPLMTFHDIDEASSFYFQINSYSKSGNDFYYQVIYKPKSEDDLGEYTQPLKFEDAVSRLKNWVDTIQQFDQIPHFFHDPIVDSYTKEYYEEYKILEDDADINPFDIRRQLLIDKYLENSVKFLDKYQKKNPEIVLDEPRDLANNLRANLTRLTKNEVIQELSQFWAIARKKGLPIIKELFFELAKELVKELGKKMIGL
jgi:hypothetical protein